MQAIAELLVALIGALIAALIGLLSVVMQFVVLAVEFAFLAATQGIAKARERNRQTRERHAAARQKRSAAVADETPPRPPPRRPMWANVVLVGVILAAGGGWYVAGRIRAARIETARKLVDQWAEDVAETIGRGNPPPQRGELPVRDPWQQPLQLFLDDFAVGTLVVVRSAGPDRRTGTVDDLLGIQLQHKPARQIAREVGGRAADKVQERVANLLRKKADDAAADGDQGADPQD